MIRLLLIVFLTFIIFCSFSIASAKDSYFPENHEVFMKVVTYKVLFPCPKSIRADRRAKLFKDFMNNFSGSIFAMNENDEIVLLKKYQEEELRSKQRCIVDLLTLEK